MPQEKFENRLLLFLSSLEQTFYKYHLKRLFLPAL